MGLSVTKLLLILVIVFVIFGAGKLPKVMGDIGKGIKSLKDGLKEGENADKTQETKQIPPKQQDDSHT